MRETIRVGEHLVDLAAGTVSREGAVVHLRAKTFALLAFMATEPGRVWSKDALMAAVWPEVIVTEDSLTQAVRDLRRVLGDGAVRTVARRGYALVAEKAGAVDGPPVVVVLPFQCLSTEADDALVIDGLVEEITQGLGRYGLVRVIARHSAFQFRPDAAPPRAAAERLGAGWFVEGMARRVGGVLRLGVVLCRTDTGAQVWSEALDLKAETLRVLQGGLPHRIVARIMLEAEREVALRPAPSVTDDMGVWRHFVSGVEALRQYGPGVNDRAIVHLTAAVAGDPGFALAQAYLALAEIVAGGYGVAPIDVRTRALARAVEAVRLAPEEARCHWILSIVRFYGRQFAAAELHVKHAVALNPHDADLMCWMGYVLALRGRAEEGLPWIEQAIALNPLHPGWYHYDLAITLQMMGCHAEAASHIQSLPWQDPWKLVRLASCQAALGDAAGAIASLDLVEASTPGWDDVAHLYEGLEFERAEDIERFSAEVARAVAVWRGAR